MKKEEQITENEQLRQTAVSGCGIFNLLLRKFCCRHDWQLLKEKHENWYSYFLFTCKKCGKMKNTKLG